MDPLTVHGDLDSDDSGDRALGNDRVIHHWTLKDDLSSPLEGHFKERPLADDRSFSAHDLAESLDRLAALDLGEKAELPHIDAHDRNAAILHEARNAEVSSVASQHDNQVCYFYQLWL